MHARLHINKSIELHKTRELKPQPSRACNDEGTLFTTLQLVLVLVLGVYESYEWHIRDYVLTSRAETLLYEIYELIGTL